MVTRLVSMENHIVTVRQCLEQSPRKYTKCLSQKIDLSKEFSCGHKCTRIFTDFQL